MLKRAVGLEAQLALLVGYSPMANRCPPRLRPLGAARGREEVRRALFSPRGALLDLGNVTACEAVKDVGIVDNRGRQGGRAAGTGIGHDVSDLRDEGR